MLLQPKDIIAIAAAVISLITLATAFLQKRFDTRRTIRSSLTDVITDLDSLFNEENGLKTASAQGSEAARLKRQSFLNGRKRFLARRAIALMDELPKKMITDFEYNSVADAFRDIGEYDQANLYYEQGIARAQGPYYKSIVKRAYANCLFRQGDFVKGRQYYTECLSLVDTLVKEPMKPKDDPYIFHIAETYERWADTEASQLFFTEAVKRFDSALPMYQRLSDAAGKQKQEAVERVKCKKEEILTLLPTSGEEQKELLTLVVF